MANDSLLRDIVLSERLDVPVLGLPVRYETNSARAVETIRATLGDGPRDPSRPDSAPVARIRFVVHGTDDGTGPRQLLFRLPAPERLLVFTRDGFGVAETDRQEAYAYVTESLVEDTEAFGRAFVEALSLMLVTSGDRFPIHAATIGRGTTAILLTGPSGSGKSTLAYAASRAGLEALGDDVAYVQLGPAMRAWTLPPRFSLRPDVAREYEELTGAVPTLLPTGKTKVVVSSNAVPSPRMVESFGICLLRRGAGPASLAEIPPVELEAAIGEMDDPGFDTMSDGRRTDVARAVSRRGGWVLRLSGDPCDSLPLIRQMLDALDRGE